ncbi:MAG: TerB family tellurite resistance protein [Puniceicoccales bacterium]|jgi:uncharacterized tellurite resistance protein B-like protein|nr:TerB family tellurite resistance protein [Puniceicoccales bacterium]
MPFPPPASANAGTAGTVAATAAAGTAELPADLRRSAAVPSKARAIVYNMLFSADPDTFRRQRALLEVEFDTTLFARFAGLSAAARLALFQLALESLRGFTDDQLDKMLERSRKIVNADGHVSATEFALLRIFQQFVHRLRNPVIATTGFRPVHLAPAPLAEAASILLSIVAHTGTGNARTPAEEFQIGAAALPEPVRRNMQLLPPQVCDFENFERALKALESIALAQKRDVLLAVANLAYADNDADANESSLVRVIARVLECEPPVPV